METTTTHTTTDPIVTAVANDDDTVTITHRSGIVRTVATDHPAAVNVTTGYNDGWATGTGRGNPRIDVIMHGHVTARGNVRTYVCGTCGDRMAATRFPTYNVPRSDGRTRNTTECRGCRDARYAIGHRDGTTPPTAAAYRAMRADAGDTTGDGTGSDPDAG